MYWVLFCTIMFIEFSFVVLLINVCCIQLSECHPTRITENGKISGRITSRVPGREVEEFLGVPYAAPPVGNLRFKRPLKPNKWWPKTLDTTSIPPFCPTYNLEYIQFHKPGFNFTNEDCLYLNIYVPKAYWKRRDPLPVLLFIHGGSNADGMGAMFDGDILAAYGQIIVVTFNYRVTVLGFYGNPSQGIDGNNGLMDQVMAMQWVQNNIHHFGGDCRRVTLYGHSAGAADVGFHLVSDRTKGLFQHAIINSGSPLATWAISPCVQSSRTLMLPEGCVNSATSFLPNHVQSAVDQLVYAESDIRDFFNAIEFGEDAFPVVVDGLYLSESPEKRLSCGQFHVDSVLIIMTKEEGLVPDFTQIEDIYGELNVSLFIDFNKHLFPEKINEFPDDVMTTSQEWLEEDIIRYPEFLHLDAGLSMFAPAVKLADYISKWNDDVYLLSFEHKPNDITPEWIGTQHGWDTFNIFGAPLVGHPFFPFDEDDKEVSKSVMNIISDFIKTGCFAYQGEKKAKYNRLTRAYNKLDYHNGQTVITEETDYKHPIIDFWYKYLFDYDNFQCEQ